MSEFPNQSCRKCKFFALQSTGYSCSGFVYIKIDGQICSTNAIEPKPKGCPYIEK